ncbi:TPA: phage baseplate protein [Haemophilus influenzae]|uniref:phage baseplate protein n=1 Tax=Haemophilus influenzae TaxID=727 RepID=UPI003530F6FB
MSIVNLLFSALSGKRTTIGVLELDALLTENTSLSSQITEYPIEDGTVISDHITRESERLSLSGVITGTGTLFNVGLGKYKLIAAKETLRELHAKRELVTIVTGLDVYEDFAIESLEIERNSDDGERLNISAEFRKIQKVTLRKEEVPPEKAAPNAKGKAGQTKAKIGKAQTGKPTNTQAQKITKFGEWSGKKE